MHGVPINCITYANRSVTITFALGDRSLPEYRRRISIVRAGKYLGMIHPVHGIKVLGISSCSFCPAIGEAAHTAECTVNQANPLFKKGALKIAAAAASRSTNVAANELGDGRSGGSGANARRSDERACVGTGLLE